MFSIIKSYQIVHKLLYTAEQEERQKMYEKQRLTSQNGGEKHKT